jgi:hypothetical protein
MGVLVTDGLGEIKLAAAFRPYTELSYLAQPVALTVDGQPIRSRHGLTFVPRADLPSAAPGLDRLVVPGSEAAARQHRRRTAFAGATLAGVPARPAGFWFRWSTA